MRFWPKFLLSGSINEYFQVLHRSSCDLALVPTALPAQTKAQKKPVADTVTARLTSARNVQITRTHGSNIPFDTISETIDGWQRLTLVPSADKADLIIEVYTGGDNDTRTSSHEEFSPETGKMDKGSSTSKSLSASDIKMTVYDARNKAVLWTGTEKAKYAVKEKARENNLVEAAERLASRFHDRLEPPERP